MRYKSAEDRAVDIAAIVIVALVAICCLYPIIYCFSMSLSGDDAIVKHAVTLLPVGLNLESYRMVLADPDFVTSFVNSVIYTVVGTAFSLFFNLTLDLFFRIGAERPHKLLHTVICTFPGRTAILIIHTVFQWIRAVDSHILQCDMNGSAHAPLLNQISESKLP